jgi:Bacterial Ig domain
MVSGPMPTIGFCTVLIILSGCSERDRLTFPSQDEFGPEVTIRIPGQDTTVSAGPAAFVVGQATDVNGIDTVYFDVQGGLSSFPPYVAQGSETVNFTLPLTTNGLGGTTILVGVSGVDMGGVHGDTVFRQLTVQ